MPLVFVEFTVGWHQSGRLHCHRIHPWKTQLTAGGWCSPRFYFHSWILVGSEVAQCYELRAFVVKISLWSGTEAWSHITEIIVVLCLDVGQKWAQIPSGKDEFADGCSSPHVVSDPGLAAWVSALHLLLLQEKDRKKGTQSWAQQHSTFQRNAAEILLPCKLWGFGEGLVHKELLGLWFSCSCCSCGFFAGSAFCRAEQQETSSDFLSAEVLPSCYGYFYKEWMKETAKCVFIQRRPLLEFPEIMDTILSLLPLEKDE